MGKLIPLRERFERHAVIGDPDTCWEWGGYRQPNGYGFMRGKVRGRTELYAHRIAYELFVGQIPTGMQIDHICHNRSCVNPAHLRAVTVKQNNEHRAGPTHAGTSGYQGVTWRKDTRKWQAQVIHNRKMHYAGCYDTAEQASAAALAVRLRLFTHNDADREDQPA